MTSLAQLVKIIQDSSEHDQEIPSLHATLRLPATENLFKSQTGALLEAVANLESYKHSLGILYLL